MRIPRIFTDQPLQANSTVALEASPSLHLARALRMKQGDALVLFNGSGGQYPATISALDGKRVMVTTADLDPVECESGLRLQLGIAVSRGERMDWIVQKATELGVSTIAPLLSERTTVRLRGEREDKKLRHWRQIAASACEQCGRNRLPDILAPQALAQWLPAVDADLKLVLQPTASSAAAGTPTPASVALLVGPEGGFSAAEIDAARQAGFSALQLGPRVLRTETAPLAAIAILQARWGDMAPPP